MKPKPNPFPHYSPTTTHLPPSPTRISHIDFSDIRRNPPTIPDQAFIKSMLIIYRVLNHAVGISQDEKLLLNLIADEIYNLSLGKNS